MGNLQSGYFNLGNKGKSLKVQRVISKALQYLEQTCYLYTIMYIDYKVIHVLLCKMLCSLEENFWQM